MRRAELLEKTLMLGKPVVLETWVQSMHWEDSQEKEMATESSVLAWEIPWTKKPGRL